MKKLASIFIVVCVILWTFSGIVYAENSTFIFDPSGIEPVSFERSIFGSDDRGPIGDATIFPYKTIAKLVMTYPNTGSNTFVGTGFMYGPSSMATAAHNLYDKNKGGYAKTITAYFGASSSTSYVKKLSVSSQSNLRVPQGWINNSSMQYDYGVIVFNSAPGVGSFGLQAVKDNLLDSNQYSVCGYSGVSYGQNTNAWQQVKSSGYTRQQHLLFPCKNIFQ